MVPPRDLSTYNLVFKFVFGETDLDRQAEFAKELDRRGVLNQARAILDETLAKVNNRILDF